MSPSVTYVGAWVAATTVPSVAVWLDSVKSFPEELIVELLFGDSLRVAVLRSFRHHRRPQRKVVLIGVGHLVVFVAQAWLAA